MSRAVHDIVREGRITPGRGGMGLPRKAFYSIFEAAARWSRSPCDIAGWAADGRLSLVTGLNFARAGESHIAGRVEISPMDVLPMFRRDGNSLQSFRARRVGLIDEPVKRWVFISCPAEGVEVHLADLLITSRELEEFERECDLCRRPK